MKIDLRPSPIRTLKRALTLLFTLALIASQAADPSSDRRLPELNDRLDTPARNVTPEFPLLTSANDLRSEREATHWHHPFKSLGRLEPIFE